MYRGLLSVVLLACLTSGGMTKLVNEEEAKTFREMINGVDYLFGQWADVDYWKARDLCNDEGMILASFDTDVQYNAVRDWILQNPDYDYWMWTSGHRPANDATWTWDGTGTPIDYSGWIAGKPDMAETEEACLNFSATGGGWDDDTCDKTMSYLCQMSP